MTLWKRVAAGSAIVAVAAVVAVAVDPIGAVRADQSPGDSVATSQQGGGDSTAEALSRAFRRASGRALPAVVHVQTRSQTRRSGNADIPESFRGTPWEELFRRRMEGQPQESAGSGFIFRPDGYVLTNNHVVSEADVVTVVLQDQRELEARVVGRDPNTDLAVLKIDADNLPTIPLGNSDEIDVGDWVVALGYPLQLGATATAGIVSAKGRTLGILGRSNEASTPLEHFIQTDAAINPGNSGGPLIDLSSRVVGINTAIASQTGFYSGYGFSVPINLARRVADDLIRYGEVRRPRLGIQIATVTPADAEVYGLPRAEGAEVTQVQPNTAAEKAGVQLGDVIVAVGDRRVRDSGELTEFVAMYQPGDEVALSVVRYGRPLEMRVRLDVFEPAVTTRRPERLTSDSRLTRYGFEARALDSALARRLRLEAEDGAVVVAEVDQYGPAARAGVQPGMIIERVNGRRIEGVGDVEAALRTVKPGETVSLIVRADAIRTIINYRVRS